MIFVSRTTTAIVCMVCLLALSYILDNGFMLRTSKNNVCIVEMRCLGLFETSLRLVESCVSPVFRRIFRSIE
jgi:hypothetical protein